MKVQSHRQSISVSIVDAIQLDAREAAFLREMARHCIATKMAGYIACERLIDILDRMQVPSYTGGPAYELFEETP